MIYNLEVLYEPEINVAVLLLRIEISHQGSSDTVVENHLYSDRDEISKLQNVHSVFHLTTMQDNVSLHEPVYRRSGSAKHTEDVNAPINCEYTIDKKTIKEEMRIEKVVKLIAMRVEK